MRHEPEAWALVHDRREPRHLAFWRGLELCVEACAAQVRPGDRWVDVGSGTGHLANTLAARGARVIGLDHDLRMARYAHRRWTCSFAVCEASSLALPDASCSGLVAISLLGCLAGAVPAAFFAEAHRVLVPGGTLCISAMNRHSLLLAATKSLAWRRASRPHRYSAYDPAALVAALRQAGLVPERQILYGHFVNAGSRICPNLEAARRRETAAEPGTRTAWARQILLLARRE